MLLATDRRMDRVITAIPLFTDGEKVHPQLTQDIETNQDNLKENDRVIANRV